MVQQTRDAFHQVAEFLFGDVDEERLDYAIKETAFDKLQKQESDNGFDEQRGDAPFFRVGKVDRWKDILTNDQVGKLEAGIGDAMERMGYKCVTREPVAV
jgi:hypothetical protein